ncbi:BatD family protein [Thiomicrorhabdus sp. ZW0627]|uniref:BatD family protein n=1 Tax=Thiomicrorhabdus sp. ZW0627 TaxID=3039774 RepID=UPI0024365562|nr:BatD family protein [Thiomicrorhabdus sp. ZW0627]MDG6774210.1 BatD family protein [Thiomicrorhabdus sp. ZW0627]
MTSQRFFTEGYLKRVVITLIFSLLSVFSTSSWSDSLTVETDRQTVEFGDIVSLYVTADFQSTLGQLDLEPLKDQFEVLGSQRSNNIQMVNGDFQSSTRWLIQLLPKQAGELIIPPFKVGDATSQPYKLTVMPMQKSLTKGSLKPYFLEAKVSTDSPYVQGQVIYSLRFYYRGRLISGNIRPPEFGNALVESLKKESVFSKQIQGQAYTVYEWIYALYPQSSGELKVTTPVFTGRIQIDNHLKQIQAVANELTLKVKPEPETFKEQSTNPWLPAKRVKIDQKWNLPKDEIRVGDTLTQTLTLNVDGLMANQLPTLTLDAQDGFKVYPDQPTTQEEKQQNGILSTKVIKRAIIPTQAGTLTLPEQSLYWWNTETDTLETTHIPGKTLKILESADKTASQSGSGTEMLAHDLNAITPTAATGKASSNDLFWKISTTVFAILWLLTMGLWLMEKRRGKNIQENNRENLETDSRQTEQAWSELDGLCKLSPPELYPAIKNWLRSQHGIKSFSELNDPALKAQLLQLEASLFNDKTFDETARSTLCEALEKLDRKHTSTLAESQLKDLYAH